MEEESKEKFWVQCNSPGFLINVVSSNFATLGREEKFRMCALCFSFVLGYNSYFKSRLSEETVETHAILKFFFFFTIFLLKYS